MAKSVKIGLIIIIIAVAFRFFVKIGAKTKNIDEKIKVTQLSFEYPKNIKEVKNLFTGYFYSKVKITISNYSDFKVTLNQIKLDLYTLKENLFVEQYSPLNQPVILQPHSNTEFEITYQVDYTSFVKLVKDNELNKNILKTIKSLISNLSLNTTVIARGFIEISGFTVKIDEPIEI